MFYLTLTVSPCHQIPLSNQLYTTILQEAPFPLMQKPLRLSDLCASAGACLEEPSRQLSSCFTRGPALRSLAARLVSGLPGLAFDYPVLSGICSKHLLKRCSGQRHPTKRTPSFSAPWITTGCQF